MDHLRENHKKIIKNNKSILKSQQEIRNKYYNVVTEQINKIPLSANGDKRI